MEINALLDPYDKLNAEVSESLVWHSGSGNDILVKAMLGADMELPSADANQPNFCFEELSVSPPSTRSGSTIALSSTPLLSHDKVPIVLADARQPASSTSVSSNLETKTHYLFSSYCSQIFAEFSFFFSSCFGEPLESKSKEAV